MSTVNHTSQHPLNTPMALSEYAAIPRVPAVYKITCLVNGKIYIGSSVDVHRRSKEHFKKLGTGEHENPYLQFSWNKHGAIHFVIEILEYCERNQTLEREGFWFNVTKCHNSEIGYNIAKDPKSPTLNQPRSPEVRRKISTSHLGIRPSEETRRKQSLAKRGKPSPNKGRKFPPEHCNNIGKSKKGNKYNNGRVHTPEWIAKVADAKAKNYVAVSPDGQEFQVRNLAAFCREHNLNKGNMVQVAKGNSPAHKGWKCRYA